VTAGVRCPACGPTSWAERLRLTGAVIVACAGCGLGRTVPAPAEGDGHEGFAADPAYFARALAEPKDRWWRRFNDAPLDLLAAAGAGPGRTLLDVGANVGYLVAAASRRGYRARGIDGSPAAVGAGRAALGVELACARLEHVVVAPGSEGVVVFNHVLEHLPDPVAALADARGWLVPGGFLLVGLPNFASPIARASGARWDGLVPSQHIWHFTPRALVGVVRAAGFAAIRWRTTMLRYVPEGVPGWGKWLARRVLEAAGRADNLLLVARVPAYPQGGHK
jgi:SAM-dependent methyltransferase